MERSWCAMSSSGWVLGSRRPSGSRFAIRWPRTRYMLTNVWTWTTFSFCAAGSANALRSGFQRAGS